MKLQLRILAAVVTMISAAAVVLPQDNKEYTDPDKRFKITLMGDWRAVSYSDAVGRVMIDFVYRDRREGLLKISRETVGARPITDVAHDESENQRIYRQGFDLIGEEPFGGGALQGSRIAFFYVEGGRKMTASYYVLKDGNDVWFLRFTGRRGLLDTDRNLSDLMVRTFKPTPVGLK